jgi:hydroxylamine reductase
MFRSQCKQSFRNSACVNSAILYVKNEDVQSLQELLIFGLKGLVRARI